MKHLFKVLTVVLLASCSNKKMEITAEYIINENWNEFANAIKINKMQLKKDSSIDLSNLNQVDIVNRLEEDSSFIYIANAKIDSAERPIAKIYFNKDNGFYWWTEGGNSKTKILGNLEKGCWYKFSKLVTYPYYVYIYIDSSNRIYRQDVNLSNY